MGADYIWRGTVVREWRVTRRDLLFMLYGLGVLNAVVAKLQTSTTGAGDLFGLDPVVAVACVIGLGLSRGGGPAWVGPGDVAAAVVFAAVVILPVKAAGWLALGMLGGYSLVAHRSDRALCAAAGVFVAICAHEVLARLSLTMLAPTLTRLDAWMTVLLLEQLRDGVSRSGNVIITGVGYELVVVAACAAFKAVAQALLCCFAVTRFFRPGWRWSEPLLWAGLAGVIVVLNTLRLALSGWELSYYHWLHGELGGMVFGLLVLTVALACALYGVRHDLRSPASDR